MQRHDPADLAEMFGPGGLGYDGTVTPTAGEAVAVTVHIRTPDEIAEGLVGSGGVAPVASAEALVPCAQLAGVDVKGARLAVPGLGWSWEVVKMLERDFGQAARLQIRNRAVL